MNLLERTGFASEKNLILKECYLSLSQLSELKKGQLKKKVKAMMGVMMEHL